MILISGIGCAKTQRTTPQLPGTDQQSTNNSSSIKEGNKPGHQTSGKLGTIEVHITDAPPQKNKDVKSIEITVSSVSVHRVQANRVQEQSSSDNSTIKQNQEQSSSDNSTIKQNQEKQTEQQGGDQWLTLDIVNNETFNLLELKGVEDILATGQLKEGKYTQIRLIIESAQATYSDNSTTSATVPSNELKFIQPFDIVQDKVTTLLLDFDADRSFTVSGSGKVIVKPVVKLIVKPAE